MPYLKQDEDIKNLLAKARTVAVVGLSPKTDSPSYGVGHYLRRAGYTIYPVNPTIGDWEGVKAYPSLADVPAPIDVVDVFRASQHLPGIVDEAIQAGAKAVWGQLGVAHDDARRKAEAAGIDLVMNRCMKVEHMRLIGH